MSSYQRRVYVVATSFDYGVEEEPDYGRLTAGFDKITPDKAYILSNDDPEGVSDDVELQARERVKEIILSKSQMSESDLQFKNPSFYDFREAFYFAYELFYKETYRGNSITLNLSGGTKLLTFGLMQAASILDLQNPLYVPQEYEHVDGGLESHGAVDQNGPTRVDLLDIDDPVPEHDRKSMLLYALYDVGGPAGITELLRNYTILNEDIDNRELYYDARDDLMSSDLVEQVDSKQKWRLTSKGERIGRLAHIRHKVQKSLDD